jgi:hypothetical protein
LHVEAVPAVERGPQAGEGFNVIFRGLCGCCEEVDVRRFTADSVVLRDDEAAQAAQLDGAFERRIEVPEEGAPGFRRLCGGALGPLTRHKTAALQ